MPVLWETLTVITKEGKSVTFSTRIFPGRENPYEMIDLRIVNTTEIYLIGHTPGGGVKQGAHTQTLTYSHDLKIAGWLSGFTIILHEDTDCKILNLIELDEVKLYVCL